MALPPVVRIDGLLEETSSEELFTLADQIESLQMHEGWGKLQDIVDRGRENARRDLELGPIREQAEYARWMGFLNGCSVQSDIARGIRKAASERRRELEQRAAEERERAEQAAA